MSFINSDLKLWYPAAGCYDYNGGSLSNVSISGFYWSATPSGRNACYLYFDNDGDVYPSRSNYRASGCSVRCIQSAD